MFDPELLAPEAIRKLSRHEYDKLVALGVFEDERVELLRGMLVTMSPQGEAHAGISAWLHHRLTASLDIRDFDVRGHSPYAASDESEPEPDISVSHRHQQMVGHPSNPLLVIEVSDSSIGKDKRVKAPIYAEAAAPEYWIVDISGEQLAVAVHTEPTPNGYRRIAMLGSGDVLRPTRLPGIAIAIDEIPWDAFRRL